MQEWTPLPPAIVDFLSFVAQTADPTSHKAVPLGIALGIGISLRIKLHFMLSRSVSIAILLLIKPGSAESHPEMRKILKGPWVNAGSYSSNQNNKPSTCFRTRGQLYQGKKNMEELLLWLWQYWLGTRAQPHTVMPSLLLLEQVTHTVLPAHWQYPSC